MKHDNKLFPKDLVMESLKQSFVKLNPRLMIKNPVMFTVEVGTAVMAIVALYAVFTGNKDQGSEIGRAHV